MSAISSLSSSVSARTPDAYETMTSEDFLKVIFTELTRQDPSKPSDSQALLEQLSTIRSIESDLQLSRRLEDIARQNEVTSAGSLVGKFAEGKTDNGATARGFIDSVSVTREGILLNLSTGFSVPMSKLEKVIDPALISITPSNPASPTTPTGTSPPAPPADTNDPPAGDDASPPPPPPTNTGA